MSTETRSSQKIWRVIDILKWGEQYFQENRFENPRREIEFLVQEILNCKRVDLYLRFEEPLTKTNLATLRNWIQRRKNREPIQYITGKAGFYDIVLNVTPDVLIPRPESEVLVSSVLEIVPSDSDISILDIGTGSGCLALALAKALPKSKIVGIDNSAKAVELAKLNAKTLNIENAEIYLLDILKEESEDKFDIIVSNPPYIPESEINNLMKDVKNFEPHSALTDFNDGLTFYRKFVEIRNMILKSNGWFFVEVGLGKHPQQVKGIFQDNDFKNIELIKDNNGDDRILKAQL